MQHPTTCNVFVRFHEGDDHVRQVQIFHLPLFCAFFYSILCPNVESPAPNARYSKHSYVYPHSIAMQIEKNVPLSVCGYSMRTIASVKPKHRRPGAPISQPFLVMRLILFFLLRILLLSAQSPSSPSPSKLPCVRFLSIFFC